MKQNKYKIVFTEGKDIEVMAFNPSEAAIKAAALRIIEGKSYEVVTVINPETKNEFTGKVVFKLS
jgi:hypothetical protein